MTQPDGNSKTTPPASAASKKTSKDKGAPEAAKGNKIWIGTIVFLILVFVVATFIARRGSDTPPPVVSADEETAFAVDEETSIEAEPVTEAADGETEPESESADIDHGELIVTSNVQGADVYLNGKRVGKTPHKATPLKPGTYKVKVVRSGYESFETSMDVTAESHTVRADLKKAAGPVALLTVDSNVSGATVTLDGKERGTTPVKIEELAPGEYELVVSAAGYEAHSETVEYSGGARNIRVELEETGTITLNEAVAVKHKHRFGGCEGVLRASAEGIRFETDHKDAFFVAFADLEQLELDGETLSVKVLEGRTYNFEERNENAEALARFHERVDKVVAQER